MAFTMLFYMLNAFIITVYTRSPFPAAAWLVIFHWMFYKSAFGTDWVSNFNYDLYYPVVHLAWTLVGMAFYWAFGHDPLLSCWMIFRGGYNAAEYAIRVIASLLIFMAVALPFELIAHFSGGILTLLLSLFAAAAAYFLLKTFNVLITYKPKGREDDCKMPPNVTFDFAAYMGIVFFVTCAVFWPVFTWTSFWQLYISVILAGFFFLLFVAAKFLWLGRDSSNLSWMQKGHEQCYYAGGYPGEMCRQDDFKAGQPGV